MPRLAPSLLLLGCTVAVGLGGCGDHIIVDDYRESWAVVRGRVLDQTDRPVAGATIRATAVQPLFAHGDTVVSASDGGYVARVSAFGASSFRADVRPTATHSSGATADTLLTGLHVVERGRGKPDTLNVVLRIP